VKAQQMMSACDMAFGGNPGNTFPSISIDSARPGFPAPSTPCSTCAPFCYIPSILGYYIKIKNPSFTSVLPLPHNSFRMPLHTPMLLCIFFSIIRPASILSLLPHPPPFSTTSPLCMTSSPTPLTLFPCSSRQHCRKY
jgi:hypothetical protein